MSRYWIVVASKEHSLIGMSQGIIQACHGKKAPLARMKKGDWVLVYSSKENFGEKAPYKKFTSIGRIVDDSVYSFQMSPDFCPFRRNVTYYHAEEADILPLVPSLDFIRNKKSWGFPFRFGFLEIGPKDFGLISERMGISVEGQNIQIR
ncbi:EVE domain-containing protein [Leptospira licerasiae]|uniref:EVE domain-containing protein n=1 Tax=Leptospira licerasiae TaxID=447106 RepID=UPI001082E2CC|nr:EVE domain-containing protein [Leptospira licerasiae]TGM88466.1 EVE domain-containing protein [Leptospira licerasiae]